jgi:hypothetical protein
MGQPSQDMDINYGPVHHRKRSHKRQLTFSILVYLFIAKATLNLYHNIEKENLLLSRGR